MLKTYRPAGPIAFTLGRITLLLAALLLAPSLLRADQVTYTVHWNAVPGDPTIMPMATFQFMVSTLASSNGTIPIGQVTILSNPCPSGSPSDLNPQLYANNTFSIDLNCIVEGYSNLYKGTLTGITSTITGPGIYNFTSTSLTTNVDLSCCGGLQHYFTFEDYGGYVQVTVPEPSSLALLASGLVMVGFGRRRWGGGKP